ncbi:MAG: PAS domain S-box protein [Pirellulaceae bacterium]
MHRRAALSVNLKDMSRSAASALLRGIPGYSAAAIAVSAAIALRFVLTAWIGPGLPTYITFYPAVMVVALGAGYQPGLLATTLVAATTAYWLLPPGGFGIDSPVDRVGLAMFSAMGVLMSVVAELYIRSRKRAAAFERAMAMRESTEALRAATARERFLAGIIENASQAFCVGYPDGRLRLFNRAFEELTGYYGEELRSISWREVLTPLEWRAMEQQKLAELQQSGQPVRYETEFVRKEGTRVPVELLLDVVSSREGDPDYYYWFLTDVSERKQAEERLNHVNAELAQRVAALEAANAQVRASRIAALNLMDDAHQARQWVETLNAELLREVAERKQAEEKVSHQNAVLEGINRIFREALTRETEEQLAGLCLAVAQEVTQSQCGFVGEATAQSRLLNCLAINDPGCEVDGRNEAISRGKKVPRKLAIHGLYGRVLRDGHAFFTNDPASHPDSTGTPHGHSSLQAFLGVPLQQDSQTIGIVAVGNREGGYREQDLSALRALAEPISQVLLRRRAESDRQKFVMLADNSTEFIGICDMDFMPFYVNEAGRCLVGLRSLEEACRTPVQEFFFPQDQRFIIEEFFPRVLREGRAEVEIRFQHFQTGAAVWMICNVFHIKDATGAPIGLATVSRDITERKQAEERLQASLDEKEVLLKEIHHRVKNNMQVISSLVALQAERLPEAAMRPVFQDVAHRVRSMALVHEKLYQSSDLARVEFAEYATSLLSYLWRAHTATASNIRLVLDLEPISISINTAVPCGLILNELASNALKHAFPGRMGGEVAVSLHISMDGEVCLRVGDNGVGLPAGLDWRQADSLGLRLIHLLAAQLHATVEVTNQAGTEFAVQFAEARP